MTDAQRDQAWVKICEELESALALSPEPAADLFSSKPDQPTASSLEADDKTKKEGTTNSPRGKRLKEICNYAMILLIGLLRRP
jgi:hypothetical protein